MLAFIWKGKQLLKCFAYLSRTTASIKFAGNSVTEFKQNVRKKSSPKESDKRTRPSNTILHPKCTTTRPMNAIHIRGLFISVIKVCFFSSLALLDDACKTKIISINCIIIIYVKAIF